MFSEISQSINPRLLYPVSFFVAFMLSLLITPISKKISYKVGAIDYPKDRGVHSKPMPLAGGTAIVFAFVATVLLVLPFVNSYDKSEIFGLIIGGILISVVGFLDDIYDLNARVKLLFQLLAALIVIYTGTTIDYINIPFVGRVVLGNLDIIITIIWIVGITNAVNLIDGLDGLAAGVSSIAAICLLLLSLMSNTQVPIAIILTASLAGSCLGFLPHNFNPATIFMGDTGSTFLGFSLAVISIQGSLKSYTALTIFSATFVLGLPIFDTFFAIIRRVITGKPIMQADRGHLHHRLVDRGYSHKKAVLTLYGVSGGFGIAGILFAANEAISAICIVILILGIWIFDIIYNKKNSKHN